MTNDLHSSVSSPSKATSTRQGRQMQLPCKLIFQVKSFQAKLSSSLFKLLQVISSSQEALASSSSYGSSYRGAPSLKLNYYFSATSNYFGPSSFKQQRENFGHKFRHATAGPVMDIASCKKSISASRLAAPGWCKGAIYNATKDFAPPFIMLLYLPRYITHHRVIPLLLSHLLSPVLYLLCCLCALWLLV